MMLTGKQVPAKKAKKLGLVDDVVPPSILIETAAELALSRIGHKPKRESFMDQLTDKDAVAELALTSNPIGRKVLFDQATLAEGGQLEDPAAFVRRLNSLMLSLAG